MTDFQRISSEIDPYIVANSKLIDAPSLHGCKDFAALVPRLKFVRDHIRKIEKSAAVSDSQFLAVAPRIASHSAQAEIEHFSDSQVEQARACMHDGRQPE